MSFLKDFDTIFNELLTDWQNQFPEADISQGSLIYIKSACLASALWGIYRYQEWIAKQIFPDTASTANLDRHAFIHGVTRQSGESDADLLTRLLAVIRQPPAGGNTQDYINWAKAVTGVKNAFCFPLAQGLGTVDIVIISDGSSGTADATEANKLHDADGSFTADMVGATVHNTTNSTQTTVSAFVDSGELTLNDDIFISGDDYTIDDIPTQDLIDEVETYINSVRPVTAIIDIKSPTVQTQAVTMTVTGANADLTQTASEITAFLNGFEPGETLYLTQLIAIAINNGADDVSIATPVADVTPTGYAMLRPGTISVS